MYLKSLLTRSILAAGLAAACPLHALAEDTIVIRTEHDAPSTSLTHQLLTEMAEELQAETDGRIVLEIHPGTSLSGGKINTMIQNLQTGNEELALIASAYFSNIDPKLNVLSLPFMNGSIDDLEFLARESQVMDQVFADQESKNIVVVDAWSRALRQIVNNERPISTPSDMEGLRFRVPEIKLWVDAFRTLGATPVPMPFSEVVTALQLGTIEGAERPTEFLKTEAWWDMARHVTMVNYTGDVLMIAFNKPFWESLDPADQKLLTTKLKILGDRTFQAEKAMEAGVLETLRENGMVVTELTPAELGQFRAAMHPVWESYSDTIGGELIESAQSALAAR
jgi:TRAP-type C4-dicarboxylate transport system substrate-binding protein